LIRLKTNGFAGFCAIKKERYAPFLLPEHLIGLAEVEVAYMLFIRYLVAVLTTLG